MAWAYVNGGIVNYSDTNATTLTLTTGWTVTAGNLLVVGVSVYQQTSGSVKDSVNNVNYAGLGTGGAAQGGRDFTMYWYVPPVGGASFPITATATASSGPGLSLIVHEYSCDAGTVSAPSHAIGGGTTGSTINLTGSLSPSGSDLIVMGARAASGTWTAMASPAFTIPVSTGTAAMQYILNYSSSVNPAMTTTSSSYWGSCGSTFHVTPPAIPGSAVIMGMM